MEFDTFMMASIDLSEDAFMKYALRAYEMFFADDDDPEISKNELVDLICSENIMKRQVLEAFVNSMDNDDNNVMTYEEIIKFFIKTL